MRKRVTTSASIDTLLKTICQINASASPQALLTDGNLPTVSAQLRVALGEKVHLTSEDDQLTSCWVELRGDTLVFSEPNTRRCSFRPRKISFATKVEAPSQAFLTSADMKQTATKLAARKYLAVYAKGRRTCTWIVFDTDKEQSRWLQAMQDVIIARDGSSELAARAAAYKKLEPLLWRQLLSEAEQFFMMMSYANQVCLDFCKGDQDLAKELRKEEQLNGWLEVQASDGVDRDDDGQPMHATKLFCVLRENMFQMFKSDMECIPEDIVCLQFATITANRESSHAFNISTPMALLEIRAENDAILEKWTDAIFALQSTEDFNKLVPNGMRKEHFLTRLRSKGGEMAARMLKRSAPDRSVYYAISDAAEQAERASDAGTCDLELGEMLKDAKLGALFRAFAQENGAADDLQLLSNFSEALGSEVGDDQDELLESEKIALLPQTEQSKLLRLSQHHVRASQLHKKQEPAAPPPSIEGRQDTVVMQEAYDLASRKLIGELMPLFCETEVFQQWLVQQQKDERDEMQLIATLQNKDLLTAFRAHVKGTAAESVLTAALLIEEFLLTSSDSGPRIDFAQRIVDAHLLDVSPQRVRLVQQSASANIADLVRRWASGSTHENLHGQVIASFQALLLVDLTAALQAPHSELFAGGTTNDVAAKSFGQVQVEQLSLRHWLHSSAGFDGFRNYLGTVRAVENVDFLADVMKFKAAEDISLTKDAAVRIHAKYVEDGSLAQVCMPTPMVTQLDEGIQPRFPSEALFDDAADHVVSFLQQDLWLSFRTSNEFKQQVPSVLRELKIAPAVAMLSVRVAGCALRHVIHVRSKLITIGSARDCDIVIKESLMKTTVIHIEPEDQGNAFLVKLLWHSSLLRKQESRKMSTVSCRSSMVSLASSNKESRSRGPSVITKHSGQKVKAGETFAVTEYEALVVKC